MVSFPSASDAVYKRQAGSLPYGAQRRLEIMRALATSPKLMLLRCDIRKIIAYSRLFFSTE